MTPSALYIIKNHSLEFIIIIILISSNFFIADYLRTTLMQLPFTSDDGVHISVANSFYKEKTLNLNLRPDYIFRLSGNFDEMIEKYPDISHDYNQKGPIYYILLGSFYDILDTNPKDLFFHASIFSNITASIFLIVFFYLIKKRFDIKIATTACVLILLIPYFEWYSARVLPVFFLVFPIAAFFFLENKKTHFILFGILAGLAHLTHPFGIFLGFSYLLYLLLHKKFRGSLIVFISYLGILSPWILRNYYLHGDVSWGLFIPFTENLSKILAFIPRESSNVFTSPYSGYILNLDIQFLPLKVFHAMFNEFSSLYGMGYLLIFLLLAGLLFFKLEKIRYYLKYVILAVPVIVYSYVAVYNFENYYAHLVFAFIIPPLILILFHKKIRPFYEDHIPRFYTFIIFYVFINFIGYFVVSTLTDQSLPNIRQLMFSVFLVIPLAVAGLYKIVGLIIQNKKSVHTNIILFILVGLILFPIAFQMVEGIEVVNNYNWFIVENSDMKIVNNFLQNMVGEDEHVASNIPGGPSTRAGLKSIALPPDSYDQITFEKFLGHYKIKYLVFYEHPKYGRHSLYNNIKDWPLLDYNYYDSLSVRKSHIINVVSLADISDISDPIHYIQKAVRLEKDGKIDEAKKIYSEIKDLETDDMIIAGGICKELTKSGKFDLSINKCNNLLEKDPFNLVARNNLLVSLASTGQEAIPALEKEANLLTNLRLFDVTIKTYEILMPLYHTEIENLQKEGKNDEAKETIDNMINSMKNMFTVSRESIIQLTLNEEFLDSLKSYDSLINNLEHYIRILRSINYPNEANMMEKAMIEVMDGRTNFLITISKEFGDSLKSYDSLINNLEHYIRTLRSTNHHNEANMMEKAMIEVMHGKANLLITLEDFHAAYRVYLELLSIDKFDPDIYKKIAAYHEKYGQLTHALHNYELALQLEPENDFLIEKIKELKDKIAV